MALLQEERLINKQRPNPAVQSAKKFGGMIKENIINPVTKAATTAMNYANPVNAAIGSIPTIKNIPNALREFDKTVIEGIKQNPGRVIGTQRGIIGPEYPETKASIAEPNMPLRDLPGNKLPPGNVDALMGVNQTAPPVNLAETATKQPGYVSPEGVAGIRSQKDLVTQQPSQQPGQQQPIRQTEFTDENYQLPKGYLKDDDPRMIERRQEAQDVQAGRMKFIEDSEAGKFDVGGEGPTIAGGRNLGSYKPLNSAGSRFQRGLDSAERIATDRTDAYNQIAGNKIRQNSQNNLTRLAGSNVNPQEAISLEDQISNDNQRREYGQGFELRDFPGLSPVIGEEIYDLAGSTGMEIDSLKALLSDELRKQGSDADFSKNPEEAVSLLKSRIRYEQSK